jgi:hypothetical protein
MRMWRAAGGRHRPWRAQAHSAGDGVSSAFGGLTWPASRLAAISKDPGRVALPAETTPDVTYCRSPVRSGTSAYGS